MKRYCLVIALALAATIASDSWGQSKRSPPPNEEAKSAKQSASTDQRGTEQAPFIIKVIPSPKTAEEASADREEREKKDSNDGALVWLTGALAIVGFFQLLVFGWQGVQLMRTVTAAKEATELASKEFISTHRPRVVLHSIKFGSVEDMDKAVPFEFRYVNIGDTKGHVTEVGTRVIYTDKPAIESDLDFKVSKIDPAMEIKSGMFGFGLTAEMNDLNRDAGMFARHDETRLFCVGYIIYTDDMGTIRQTGFCRQYNPETHRWIRVEDSEYEYAY